MIEVRRANARHHHSSRGQQRWRTFFTEGRAVPADGFGDLDILDEVHLPPGARMPRRTRHQIEMITYVRDGAITYRDSTGIAGVVRAGEFHHATAGRSVRHDTANASENAGAEVYEIGLRAMGGEPVPAHGQARFTVADRRGRLRTVASPDGRGGSVAIRQNAVMFSALLDIGQHVVHELGPRRKVWLQVLHGEVTIGDYVLTTGDGAGFTLERSVSVTAREASEILLVDLEEPPPAPPKTSAE